VRNRIISLAEKSDPGIWGGMLCRKRYIDEMLVASLETKLWQWLTWAWDLTRDHIAFSNLPVREVDQRENVEVKVKRLRKALGTIPANVKLVPADFDRDDLGSILAAQGHSAAKQTFFVWGRAPC
jgi:O-methyltransferase involved in polyketide biosynthesis